MIKRASMLGVMVLLTGCVGEIQQRTSDNYMMVGMRAEAQGDWDAARKAFARAVVNAEQAKLPVRSRAIRTYEYGRALGVTCFFDLAEAELNTAHDLDKQAGQPLYLSLTELARLTLDQKKYQQSAGYFERTLKALDLANAQQGAPIGYADILAEYGQALAGVGRDGEAAALKSREAEIRAKNPGKHSITDRTPYGKFCSAK